MDFQRGTVALSTRKTRTGNVKRDEMPMNPEVRATLLWLWENREGTSGHVFTCPVEPFVGQPYKTAAHVMRRLCKRAGVKPFGLSWTLFFGQVEAVFKLGFVPAQPEALAGWL